MNWDKLESEHNRHYDPYADKCPHCGAEDSFEEDIEIDDTDPDDEFEITFYFCCKCGERVEMQ